MADSSIFDDFEDPAKLSKAFCQQMSAHEYSENVTTETDKALGELCLLLDKQPEIYASVLRKRKRDQIESDGVLSFLKSKVLGLVHGDDYAQNLVSDSECLRQTQALKVGICKTFQYAQELKEEPVRHSQRLASKLATRRMEKSKCNNKRRAGGENSISNSSTVGGVQEINHNNDCGDGQKTKPHVNCFETEGLRSKKRENDDIFEEISLSSKNDINHNNSKSSENGGTDNSDILMKGKNGNEDENDSQKPEKRNELKSVPPPPPPPPLPADLTSSKFPNLTPTVKKLTDGFLSHNNTPDGALQTISSSDMNTSSGSFTSSGLRRKNDQQKSDESAVTPINGMERRLRSHNNYGSNASLTSIHSEIIASNPISRLKTTQIVRSPGGTPIRPSISSRLPSEPLHKALVTAVRSKFKNIHTPSPRSALSSANNSGAFSFSP